VTIVEFLRARLDEDEAAAEVWSTPFSNPTAEQRAHIARHDPARVLAEVEAKRRIVERLGAYIESEHEPEPEGLWEQMDHHAWDTLYDLALPYADHPEYDEAWRP
jgi:hypothetical protein